MEMLPKKKNHNNLDSLRYIYELSEEEKEILIWYRVQEDNVKDYLREEFEKETKK